MTDEVWVSSVMSKHRDGVTNKLGVRERYFGEDWAPPTEIRSPESDFVVNAARRHQRGERLDRTELTEALYVFNPKRWKRVKDLFCAGPFFAVKGKLAEILISFDLGDCELIEFPIYEMDKTTPISGGPFYFLNFGAFKNSFVPERSNGIKHWFTHEQVGFDLWKDNLGLADGDIAVTTEALRGADLWFEPTLYQRIFMSGRLHDAILAAKLKVDFGFSKARILGQDA